MLQKITENKMYVNKENKEKENWSGRDQSHQRKILLLLICAINKKKRKKEGDELEIDSIYEYIMHTIISWQKLNVHWNKARERTINNKQYTY